MATKKTVKTDEEILEEGAPAPEVIPEETKEDKALEAALKEIEELKARLEKAEEAPEPPADPWEKRVKIRSPRVQGLDSHFVAVNGRRYQIPADGREYEVPEPIAEALRNYLDAEAKADEYMKKVEEESYDPVLKPKQL